MPQSGYCKNEKERFSLLSSLIESSCKYDEVKEDFEKLTCHIIQYETECVSKDRPEDINNNNAKTTGDASLLKVTNTPKQGCKSYAEAARTVVPPNLPKTNDEIQEPKEQTGEDCSDADEPNDILLIGSSIFKYFNRRGLLRNVHVNTNRGARIDDIKLKLQQTNLIGYKTIILYCGGNDAASGKSDTDIYWDYADLLNYIQDNYPGLNIYVCGLMPRRDADT